MSRTPPPEGPDRWHVCDIRDTTSVSEMVERIAPTHLVHAAWYVEHGKFWHAPENVQMLQASIHLFECFGRNGGVRAVGIGTCGEYAFGPKILNEATSPCVPSSIYGQCKAAAGLALMATAGLHGFSAAWGRVFFPYGPGAPVTQFLPSLAARLAIGDDFEMSDGTQLRDFIHVHDVAGAVAVLCGRSVEGAVNVGRGEGITLKSIAKRMQARSLSAGRIVSGTRPRAEHDPDAIVADVTRLKTEAGWQPVISLDDGLLDVLREYRAA